MKLAAVLSAKGSKTFTTIATLKVRDAVAELAANNIGALIVVDERGYPEGIISERDIIRRLAADPGVLDLAIADVMTSPVLCGSPADDTDAVLRMMTANHFRHLPVVDGGSLVGTVTVADLVKAEVTDLKGAVETMETLLLK